MYNPDIYLSQMAETLFVAIKLRFDLLHVHNRDYQLISKTQYKYGTGSLPWGTSYIWLIPFLFFPLNIQAYWSTSEGILEGISFERLILALFSTRYCW